MIFENLWSWWGSNPRPQACKARALPAELQPRIQRTKSQKRDKNKKIFAHRSEAMKSGPAWTRTTDLCVISTALYPPYVFKWEYHEINHGGFPHSEISGSKVICTFPKLIAAYHVLHRLHVPRHPPYTLSSFTKVFFLKMTWLHQLL